MFELFSNNAGSLLNGAITNTATSAALTPGTGGRFPSPSGGDYFRLTLVGISGGVETSWEIIKVTARSGDTLTIERGQEGTAAVSWPSGTRIELRPTAGQASRLEEKGKTADSYAVLRAINGASGRGVMLLGRASVGDGGGGDFIWDSSDLSAEVAVDEVTAGQGNGGVYVAPASAPTGASGAWVRQYSGRINVKWYGATGDGATDDYPSFSAVSKFVGFLGGGSIYVPSGHYRFTQAGDSFLMRSHMELFGDGYSSFIDSTANTIFIDGMNPDEYPLLTWSLGAAIAVGDTGITLNVAANANNFTVGDLAILRSVSSDSTVPAGYDFPSFVELVKIKSVNGGTGFVEFEDPIEDAVFDPELALSNLDPGVVEGIHIHNLRLRAAYTSASSPLRFHGGIYRSKVHDLWTEGSHCLLANGVTKSEIYSINSIIHATAGILCRIVELKSGSYRSEVHDINCVILNEDGNTTKSTPIDVGERSRDITVRDIKCYAPNVDFLACVSIAGATRVKHKNISVVARNAGYGLNVWSADNETGTYKNDFDSDIENIRIRVLGMFTVGISVTDQNAGTHTLNVRSLHIDGVNGDAYSEGVTPLGMVFSNQVADIEFHDIKVDGPVKALYAGTDVRIYDSKIGWYQTKEARGRVRFYNCEFTGVAPPRNAMFGHSIVVSTTTPNNVVQSLVLPQDLPYRVGDRIRVKVYASIPSGRAAPVHLALATQAGVLYQQDWPTANNGAAVIEGDIVITADSLASVQYRAMLHAINKGVAEGSTTLQTGVNTTTTDIVGQVRAWVDNGADSLTIIRTELQFVPFDQGLS